MARAAGFQLGDLPQIRGKYTVNAPLGAVSWFRAGGEADVLYKPADSDDLAQFLGHCPPHIPVTILGVMSNTIIRDGGVRGVVIRLGRAFNTMTQDGDQVIVGAAMLDGFVATQAAEWGLTGFEFLSGIPGTIGGAVRMNAGATGSGAGGSFGQTALRDILSSIEVVDRQGQIHQVLADELDLSYRHCGAPADWIFTKACLRATGQQDPAQILAQIDALKTARAAAQPIKSMTGGSTFANPSAAELAAAGHPPQQRAWQLIDQAGCRGLRVGGAQISELHCNFIINTADASAYDIESLGEMVRARVLAQTGVTLRWEIKRLGEFAAGQNENMDLK